MSTVPNNGSPARKFTDKTLKFAVALAGVIAALAIGIPVMFYVLRAANSTFGTSTYYNKAMPAPPTKKVDPTVAPDVSNAARAAADLFLADLQADRVNDAWSRTTSKFKDDHQISEFQALMKQHPAFRSFSQSNLAVYSRDRLRVVYNGRQGSLSFVLTVVHDSDEEWKVDGLKVAE
jgi:hypothetical protein